MSTVGSRTSYSIRRGIFFIDSTIFFKIVGIFYLKNKIKDFITKISDRITRKCDSVRKNLCLFQKLPKIGKSFYNKLKKTIKNKKFEKEIIL